MLDNALVIAGCFHRAFRSFQRIAGGFFGQAKRSIPEARDSVADGHFCGQRLQRGEPLVAVADDLLQIGISLLQRGLLAAQ